MAAQEEELRQIQQEGKAEVQDSSQVSGKNDIHVELRPFNLTFYKENSNNIKRGMYFRAAKILGDFGVKLHH